MSLHGSRTRGYPLTSANHPSMITGVLVVYRQNTGGYEVAPLAKKKARRVPDR